MTIVGFRSENVRKISVVAFQPTPTGLVIISGRNGQGKTSVLDTIEMVLGGADHIPNRPVRKGQDKATGEIDIAGGPGIADKYNVKRTVTPSGGGSLIVRDKDGQKVTSPQQILDGLFGRLSFDPLAFARQKPEERTRTLRELLGLDFSKFEQEYKTVYDRRTEVNRAVKAAEATLKSTPGYSDVPAEELKADEILDEQKKALAFNQENIALRNKYDQLQRSRQSAQADYVRAFAEVAQIKGEIERLTNKLHDVEKGVKECQVRRDNLADQVSEMAAKVEKLEDVKLEPFGARLRELESTNSKVRANQARKQLLEGLKNQTREADKLTERLDAIEREKRDAIANAKWPVSGLAFNEQNEVTFNGIPFDGCSTAEQLKISVAMGLALNPKLKVLLVRQGNDLDDDNLKLMAELATTAGAQIWLERVDPSGQSCVVIEDGHIAEAAA